MAPGRVLDEPEVLTHSASESTIVTKPMAPVFWRYRWIPFDAVLERDPEFARRVLQLESGQLQRLMRVPGKGRPDAVPTAHATRVC